MASSTSMPHGYDYEFVEEVHHDYICVICQHPMEKPIQTKCGHRFCKACLDETLKRNARCPVDRQRLTAEDDHKKRCDSEIVSCIYQNIGCRIEVQRKDLDDHIEDLEQHFPLAIEKILSLQSQMEETKNQSETRYHYIWKIEDFSQQLEYIKRQAGLCIRLESDPFYTHKYGYKLKLRLYPNGYGDGKGTHITVALIVMRGEYDGILTWPFDRKVTFILMDQKPHLSKRKNIERCLGGNPYRFLKSYQRPTTGENSSVGFPDFVSHETLSTENYIAEGALFLKLELEKP